MQFIQDPPADGPTNMQRDRDLLESLGVEAILRIYAWAGSWASYGYFQSEAEAIAHFAGEKLQFVKRPTGGGIVDHRQDLTYSLFIPKRHNLANVSRSECYRLIHQALQVALKLQGVASHLLEQEKGQGPACFVHAVPGDLINPVTGKKIAGAAQRRTRQGLLHQGSILAPITEVQTFSTAFLNQLED